jgi:hypothetical protein
MNYVDGGQRGHGERDKSYYGEDNVRVKYRRASIDVGDIDKPKICGCCNRGEKEGIHKIDLHHWIYAYKTSEVRKDHRLALKNTSWLCVPCHNVGDSLRIIMEHVDTAEKLVKIMREAMK